MSGIVRAAVLVEPGRIDIQEFPRPELEEGAMLVKPLISGVCGTDKNGYLGLSLQYPGTPREVFGPYPAIPGHENVAVIIEFRKKKNSRFTDFYGSELKEGDRIVVSPDILCGECYWCRHSYGYTWCDNIASYGHMSSQKPPFLLGGWSELMYVMPKSHVFKVPNQISDEIAVLAEPMAVTYSLDIAKSFSAQPIEGFNSASTLLVLGVGPIGLCHIIKSRLLGAGEIIAVDKSDFRLGFAKEFGATHVLNIERTTKEKRHEYVLETTDGRGADVVIECAGVPEAFVEGLEMLRQGGTCIELGNFVDRGSVTINPSRHICAKSIRLFGQTNLSFTGMLPSMKLMQINSDKYDFNKIVTHRYNLGDAKQAVLKAMEPDSMKVVIEA